MVTQLIEVLILAPLAALGRFRFGMLVVAAFDWRLALGAARAGAAAGRHRGVGLGRPLRVGFRGAREANARAHLAHPGDPRRHPRDQGLRRRGRRAAALRGREPRAPSPPPSRRARASGLLTSRSFWVRRGGFVLASAAAALLAARGEPLHAFGGARLHGLDARPLQLLQAPLRRRQPSLRRAFRTWGAAQDIAIGLDRVFELLDLEPEVSDARGRDPAAAAAARRALPGRALPLPARPPRARGRGLRGARRQRDGDRRAHRLGQEHADGAAAAALRSGRAARSRSTASTCAASSVASLRARVAIALQENLLFGASVRENIRYAVPDASDAAVREAARVAARRRVHRRAARGLRHAARRARHQALDRPAPAPLDRARGAEGRADPGPRRAHRVARRRDRAARARATSRPGAAGG